MIKNSFHSLVTLKLPYLIGELTKDPGGLPAPEGPEEARPVEARISPEDF